MLLCLFRTSDKQESRRWITAVHLVRMERSGNQPSWTGLLALLTLWNSHQTMSNDLLVPRPPRMANIRIYLLLTPENHGLQFQCSVDFTCETRMGGHPVKVASSLSRAEHPATKPPNHHVPPNGPLPKSTCGRWLEGATIDFSKSASPPHHEAISHLLGVKLFSISCFVALFFVLPHVNLFLKLR